ncbi:MAG: Smr/MutS family protein, partial [Chloroflexia bacterium]|nr:Smr/MutS family protein [Chloroflexia bacterium]
MSLHDAVLAKLELPAVMAMLAARCRFGVAAERARVIGPSGDPTHVRYLLDVTAEAVDLLTTFPEVTIGGARDVRGQVERAAKGARLQPPDLLLVLDMVSAARNLRRAFFRLPEVDARFPKLLAFVESLAELPEIEADIGRSIGPRGDVLDTASPALAQIRREVRVAQSRLMERLNALVSGGRYAAALQDAIVTTRDGRYVVPVKAEARAALPGVVHDTSASGQTIFVEPFDVVELNNTWREKQIDEGHEIDRVLDGLSARVGDRAEVIAGSVEATAAIDLAMAKALLAFDLKANRPLIWDSAAAGSPTAPGVPTEPGAPTDPGTPADPDGHPKHRLRLVRARHPLLNPATVVPIDVELGDTYRVLVITGPNTGGKTVALKTIGLLCLMAQTGLFIPAEDDSVLSVFPAVFADIGDEQSITQSLSTFSAHMRTVIAMLEHVSPDSLVLLDEMGAGTDPQEGSALARSLISELLERGPLVVGTTHYSEVKAFAYATPGVENASVEFDVQTLAPTYKLMIGVPGRSNALAIAKRLGMPQTVLGRAAGLIDPDEVRADALLQDIRRRRDEADAIVTRAKGAEQSAAQLRRLAARELRQAEQERQTARAEALAEAEAELAAVRDTFRRLQRDRETVALTREHVEGRRLEVEKAGETVRVFKRKRPAPTRQVEGVRKPIAAGDRVQIVALGQEGEVLSVSDGTADVMLGALKMRQLLDALERLGRVRPTTQERAVFAPPAPDPVAVELDLRGYRAGEIGEMLERYLENAYRSGLPFVRIIHGKGTGALRNV